MFHQKGGSYTILHLLPSFSELLHDMRGRDLSPLVFTGVGIPAGVLPCGPTWKLGMGWLPEQKVMRIPQNPI